MRLRFWIESGEVWPLSRGWRNRAAKVRRKRWVGWGGGFLFVSPGWATLVAGVAVGCQGPSSNHTGSAVARRRLIRGTWQGPSPCSASLARQGDTGHGKVQNSVSSQKAKEIKKTIKKLLANLRLCAVVGIHAGFVRCKATVVVLVVHVLAVVVAVPVVSIQ